MRARVKVTGDDVHSSHDTASPCEVLSEMDAEDPDFLRRTPGPRGRGTELRAAAVGPRRELPPVARSRTDGRRGGSRPRPSDSV